MAFLEGQEIYDAYVAATDEATRWREDYPEYERLMNNGLLEGLDETLPEVNDGSLAAALFKLPKRIVNSKLTGRAKALDSSDGWLTELANLQWENNITKNANSQAPFIRKWKDAVRKAAGYGGQPIINLFVENGTYTGSDFIIPLATDVKLEAGKVSDYDSDVIFWDVYYSRLQWKNMIEDAKEEMKDKATALNKWDVALMEEILDNNKTSQRSNNEEHSDRTRQGTPQEGIHVYIAFQRGIDAPFSMCHKDYKDRMVRTWSNPDPTGDIPVHYLYCYQDFINPYGVGIVQLAGGTQNVLDYMRQADVRATQLGVNPPKVLSGSSADLQSVNWDSLDDVEGGIQEVGTAKLEPREIGTNVYSQLPQRIEMYLNSLNKVLPMGDTSVSAAAGDPLASKTPAGVKMQAANLSIDDDDFRDNLYITYEAVAKSMINTHFANMQGSDAIRLTDEERDILAKAGIEFPLDEEGNPTNELVIEWEQARGTFDFEVDAEADKAKDEEKQLEGLMSIAEFVANPQLQQLMMTGGPMILGTKKVDIGELIGTIADLSTDNDKIVQDATPEDMQAQMQPGIDPATGMPVDPAMQPPVEGEMPMESPAPVEGEVMPPEAGGEVTPEQAAINVEAVMDEYQVDQETAAGMLEAERQGWSDEEIAAAFLEEQGAAPNV